MESLSEGVWDVVIAGTSLPQSLLALSLSRTDKKVLHVDRNGYYGGHDAGFSLHEARDWAEHLNTHGSQIFFDAIVEEVLVADSDDIRSPLGLSRSYTLSLNPQIVYAQSRFLPALVSSQIHSQLEFLAVGSWWVFRDGRLQKIPSTREDVFNDESLSMGTKRRLMKFLRYVLQEDGRNESGAEGSSKETLKEALKDRYKLPLDLEAPMVALALSPAPAGATNALEATARIQRHMQSVGYFGPGFSAVIAKYGGNAEIAQVACRAQAVGGGVYLLGHGLVDISELVSDGEELDVAHPEPLLKVKLSNGTEVRTRWVVGGRDDLPTSNQSSPERNATSQVETLHSIDIISDPLKHLFPPTSETGPVPAAVIVLVEDEADACPLYLQIHSEDTGECRAGQCVIYSSIQSAQPGSRARLRKAVASVITIAASETRPQCLWTMSYVSRQPTSYQNLSLTESGSGSNRTVLFPTPPHDLSLQEQTLGNIRTMWEAIMGPEAEQQTFLRFEEREQDPETNL